MPLQVGLAADFAVSYSKLLGAITYRFVHKTFHTVAPLVSKTTIDFVSTVPGDEPCGYKHVGKTYYIHDTGKKTAGGAPAYSLAKAPTADDVACKNPVLYKFPAICKDTDESVAVKEASLVAADLATYFSGGQSSLVMPVLNAYLADIDDHLLYYYGSYMCASQSTNSAVVAFVKKFFPTAPGKPASFTPAGQEIIKWLQAIRAVHDEFDKWSKEAARGIISSGMPITGMR